jgi:hypothetical protein
MSSGFRGWSSTKYPAPAQPDLRLNYLPIELCKFSRLLRPVRNLLRRCSALIAPLLSLGKQEVKAPTIKKLVGARPHPASFLSSLQLHWPMQIPPGTPPRLCYNSWTKQLTAWGPPQN